MKRRMLHRGAGLVVAVCGLLAVLSPPSQAAIYEGLLSYPGGGLMAGGAWESGSHILAWTVSDEDYSGRWHYYYSLSVTGDDVQDISHVILEVSDSFGDGNLFNVSWGDGSADIQTYSPTGNGTSNPGLPGAMYGLKLEGIDGTEWVFDFFSDRVPVWGDFYAKTGGPAGGTDGYLFNAGFGNPDFDPDPDLYPASTDYRATGVFGHALVPDTVAVPVPGAMLLGAVGLGVASSRLRRKRA